MNLGVTDSTVTIINFKPRSKLEQLTLLNAAAVKIECKFNPENLSTLKQEIFDNNQTPPVALLFAKTTITKDNAKELANFLVSQKSKKLKELGFYDVSMDPKSVQILATALPYTSIETVTFNTCTLTMPGVMTVPIDQDTTSENKADKATLQIPSNTKNEFKPMFAIADSMNFFSVVNLKLLVDSLLKTETLDTVKIVAGKFSNDHMSLLQKLQNKLLLENSGLSDVFEKSINGAWVLQQSLNKVRDQQSSVTCVVS